MTDHLQGRNGFFIRAYRNLTTVSEGHTCLPDPKDNHLTEDPSARLGNDE